MTSASTPAHQAAATDLAAVAPEGCGCPEGQRAATVTRRTVLAGAGAVGVLGAVSGVVPGVATQYAFAETGYSGDTVVVLSLRGGLDGLSAVAPVGDPEYFTARPNIAIPQSRVLPLNSMFGLHPALAPLKPLYDAGSLAAVHAVGQVNRTRSHFAAMEEMENAAPGSYLRTGWIDRMIGVGTSASTFSAVAVGTTSPPSSMAGPNPELAVRTVDTFKLSGAGNATEVARWTKALQGLHVGAPSTVAAPAAATLGALSTIATLQSAGYTPANGAIYPAGELGDSLRDVARLIKADLGLRAATVDVGNWDMHTGLGQSDSGWLFRQLTEVGKALAAFHTDLGSKMADVTVVTLSEFGRRVAENASGGVDHGHGNVCLLMGGGVVGGQVYGRWPGLATANLDAGDLVGTTDYRTILAEILEKRAKMATSGVFPNLPAGRLGALRAKA